MNGRPARAREKRPGRSGSAGALLPLPALMLGGCMSLSGLDGGSNYACKAPEGVTCDSVSGTYANAVLNNLPSQRRAGATGDSTPAALREAAGASRSPRQAAVGGPAPGLPAPATAPQTIPLRSSARILRLWIKPWEDADRDLHDQGHVYVRIDDGQWLIEHAQRQIRAAYAPLRPPPHPDVATPARHGSAATPPPAPPLQLPGLNASPRRPADPD